MSDHALGGQTATVIAQVRGRHNEYRDGSRTDWPGCLVYPEQAPTESVNREERTTSRYLLFGPPGFRAKAVDEVEVSPGPVDEDGSPARLQLVGAAEPQLDDEGVEDHVTAVLRRRTG